MLRRVFASSRIQRNLFKAVIGTSFAYGIHSLAFSEKESAEFCGIVGYLGDRNRAFDVLRTGVKILENRGYDSCGRCL